MALVLVWAGVASAEPKKSTASPDGLEAAKKNIEVFRAALKKKTPDELVKTFIPDARKTYGGNQYFYNYMANIAIQDELAARGTKAEQALQAHRKNKTRIFEAINGPGETIESICTALLAKLDE